VSIPENYTNVIWLLHLNVTTMMNLTLWNAVPR